MSGAERQKEKQFEFRCPYCEKDAVRDVSEPLFLAALASSRYAVPFEPVEWAPGYLRAKRCTSVNLLAEAVVEQMAFLKRTHPEAYHTAATASAEVVEAIARKLRSRYVRSKPYMLPCGRAGAACGRQACAKYPGFEQRSEKASQLYRAMGPPLRLRQTAGEDSAEVDPAAAAADAADDAARISGDALPEGESAFAVHASLIDIVDDNLRWEFEDHGDAGNGFGREEEYGTGWGRYIKADDITYMVRVLVPYPIADRRNRPRGGGEAEAQPRRYVKGYVELRRGVSNAAALEVVLSTGKFDRPSQASDVTQVLDSSSVHVWPLIPGNAGEEAARRACRTGLLDEVGAVEEGGIPGPRQTDVFNVDKAKPWDWVLEKGKWREGNLAVVENADAGGTEEAGLTEVFDSYDKLMLHMVDEHYTTRPRPFGFDLLARDYRNVGSRARLVFGGEGSGPAQLHGPCCLAFVTDLRDKPRLKEAEVLVVDGDNNRVTVFKVRARSAEAVRRIGKPADGGKGSSEGGEKSKGKSKSKRGGRRTKQKEPELKVSPPGTLRGPSGVAFDGDGAFGGAGNGTGRVAVADSLNHRVQVFAPNGSLAFVVGKGRGSGPGELRNPRGVCFTPDGFLAVVEEGNHRVSLFSVPPGLASASFAFSFGSRGSDFGELNFPVAIACRPCPPTSDEEHVFAVVDQGNHRVCIFQADGLVLRTIGGTLSSAAPGMFNSPSAVAFGPDGDLMVADTKNNRVQLFWSQAAGGGFAWEFGDAQHFPAPAGVAWGGQLFDEDNGSDSEDDDDDEEYDDEDDDDSDGSVRMENLTPDERMRRKVAAARERAEQEAAQAGALLVCDAKMHKIKAFAPPHRVAAGTLGKLPRDFVRHVFEGGWLHYDDARTAAATNMFFLAACRAARLAWALAPFDKGSKSRYVTVYGRREKVRASGLFALHEAWGKWGGAGFLSVGLAPDQHGGFDVQQGVMRFEAGFRSAVADCNGPRFWHENHKRLQMMFGARAKRRAQQRLAGGSAPETLANVRDLDGQDILPAGLIGYADWLEIMTFAEEVRLGISEYESNIAIRPPAQGGSGSLRPPPIFGQAAGASAFDEREDIIREHLRTLVPKVDALYKKESLAIRMADMTPQEKAALKKRNFKALTGPAGPALS